MSKESNEIMLNHINRMNEINKRGLANISTIADAQTKILNGLLDDDVKKIQEKMKELEGLNKSFSELIVEQPEKTTEEVTKVEPIP